MTITSAITDHPNPESKKSIHQKEMHSVCNPRFWYRNCGSSSTAGKRLRKLKD
jgi:hypothetical protein